MSYIDILIFFIYFAVMLSVGLYFFKKNDSIEDYYLGGRTIGSWHIGLSVVATDVGGGFSIGLGGLGFTIGLAGSWMLFTGLIGAWLPLQCDWFSKHEHDYCRRYQCTRIKSW